MQTLKVRLASVLLVLAVCLTGVVTTATPVLAANKKVSIEVGYTAKFDTKYKSVSSANTAVATASAKKGITGVGAGTTKVFAEKSDGTKDTYAVTVTAAKKAASSGSSDDATDVSADGDIFQQAKGLMNKLYISIAGISTISAALMASICLFLMFFSKSSRTVEESVSWLKRIAIAWLAIMLMGAIVSYFVTGLNVPKNPDLSNWVQ